MLSAKCGNWKDSGWNIWLEGLGCCLIISYFNFFSAFPLPRFSNSFRDTLCGPVSSMRLFGKGLLLVPDQNHQAESWKCAMSLHWPTMQQVWVTCRDPSVLKKPCHTNVSENQFFSINTVTLGQWKDLVKTSVLSLMMASVRCPGKNILVRGLPSSTALCLFSQLLAICCWSPSWAGGSFIIVLKHFFVDFSSACWSDCSWDPFAFSPHNTSWQRVPQFCHLLCEQGLQQLVLNLLLDGVMWSLTFLCSHFSCPSEIADPSYLSLTVSFSRLKRSGLLHFFPSWRNYSILPPILLLFFCTFSVLIYLLSVTSSVSINQGTDPPQVYIARNALIVIFYISNFSVLFL